MGGQSIGADDQILNVFVVECAQYVSEIGIQRRIFL